MIHNIPQTSFRMIYNVGHPDSQTIDSQRELIENERREIREREEKERLAYEAEMAKKQSEAIQANEAQNNPFSEQA